MREKDTRHAIVNKCQNSVRHQVILSGQLSSMARVAECMTYQNNNNNNPAVLGEL